MCRCTDDEARSGALLGRGRSRETGGARRVLGLACEELRWRRRRGQSVAGRPQAFWWTQTGHGDSCVSVGGRTSPEAAQNCRCAAQVSDLSAGQRQTRPRCFLARTTACATSDSAAKSQRTDGRSTLVTAEAGTGRPAPAAKVTDWIDRDPGDECEVEPGV